jgi:HlyD family secretion protein
MLAKPSCLKVGQQVTVKIDTENEMKSYPNSFLIASSAEFTPKIIQTKEERVNRMPQKNKCENDGGLKIGMPAEMWITP